MSPTERDPVPPLTNDQKYEANIPVKKMAKVMKISSGIEILIIEKSKEKQYKKIYVSR